MTTLNERYAQAMGLGPDDMIDYESPTYNAFMNGMQVGQEQAGQIAGLGTITNEDNGVYTLRFINEDAGQDFMNKYYPTVEIDDMPPAVDWNPQFRSKDRQPEKGWIIKGWDNNNAVWAGYFNGDPKGTNCDWWAWIPGK